MLTDTSSVFAGLNSSFEDAIWAILLRLIRIMQKQFENLRATELYCPRCRRAQPVRERLLLVLPRGELHDYRCTVCGESLGEREVKSPQKIVRA